MTVVQEILNRFIIDDHHHHHSIRSDLEEDQSNVDGTDTTIAKSVAMCVLFLASLIIGLIPLKLSRMFHWDTNPKNNKIIIMLLCFGGGVLLCTTFLHLLPEVTENIEALQHDGTIPELRMHLGPLLMCIGFFTMYFVEEVAHYYIHQKEKNCNLSNALRRSLSIRRGDMNNSSGTSTNDLVKSMNGEEVGVVNLANHVPSHTHTHMLDEDFARSLRGFLVVLALSVHELFEGLAVGLEGTASSVWYMFGAVSAHKLVIAFCIGVELVSTKTKTLLVMVYVLTFAIVSPLGIAIGILITEDAGTKTDVPSAILQGLATGTLLYVVFFEILQKQTIGGLRPYLAVLLGFLVMFAITILGIGIGILLSSAGATEGEEGADVTSVVLQGMAAGTLLYVVFFEVLTREKNSGHGNGLWKLIAIVAGFSLMLALQVATGHEHSHGDSHDDGDEHLETTATALGAVASAVTSLPADVFTHTY